MYFINFHNLQNILKELKNKRDIVNKLEKQGLTLTTDQGGLNPYTCRVSNS